MVDLAAAARSYFARLSIISRASAEAAWVGKIIAFTMRMMRHTSTYMLAALAMAATTACGNDNARHNSATAANTAAGDQRSAKAATSMTLTGCLQQVGRTYVVTRLNEPSREGVGTTGNGAAVEREQLRMAANAYRLEGKEHGDWDQMIGKQVRVSGTVDEAADLPRPGTSTATGGDRPSATSGTSDGANREKIDKGDLAKIDVSAMTVVSENCGHGAADAASSPRQ
ncbi:MAG: hypothetical protein JWL71_3261 [Acidobacteria bacterium]|nr:hypothetical protein [Acidobacteriota bacterium]